MPMLIPIVIDRSPITSGSVTVVRTRSASTSASGRSVFSQTMANSSPPSRAAVSLARSTEVSRPANATRTASPMGWPCSSLIALKPSRSMISTQVGVRSRCPRSRACRSRSWKRIRLGRPVSGSCSDRCTSAASSAFRSVMSSTIMTRCAGSPSGVAATQAVAICTGTAVSSSRRNRHSCRIGRPGCRLSTAYASRAPSTSSGWIRSNRERPSRSAGVRPRSAPSAAFASVKAPSGVHSATPMGALAKALPRSTGGRASTSSVMPFPPLLPAQVILWITSVPRTRALHAARGVQDAKGTRGRTLEGAVNDFDLVLPAEVDIREVGMRDGLQLEAPVPLGAKLEMLEALVATGVRRIEATSFVSPKAVPALADADQVAAELSRWGDVHWSALVANARGAVRAVDAGVADLEYVVSASDGHSRANAGRPTAEAVAAGGEVAALAHGAGGSLEVIIAPAWDCPFDGRTPISRTVDVARAAVTAGADQLCLGDTIGTTTPLRVVTLVDAVRRACPGVAVGVHFHDTRGTGQANALAAVQAGVTQLDSSVGGLGGCPFAPGASGNIATEELVYMLEESGVRTGLDLDAVLAAAAVTEDAGGHDLPSSLSRAGGRSAPRAAATR